MRLEIHRPRNRNVQWKYLIKMTNYCLTSHSKDIDGLSTEALIRQLVRINSYLRQPKVCPTGLCINIFIRDFGVPSRKSAPGYWHQFSSCVLCTIGLFMNSERYDISLEYIDVHQAKITKF